MEGTTNTKGSLGGNITDPGRLSGGSFFLSDRWFSLDHPIEAEIGLMSITALAAEVKRLLVTHSTSFQLPTRPFVPPWIEPGKRITPVKPIEPEKKPTEPPAPRKPLLPEPMPWYKHFFSGLKIAAVIAIVGGFVLALFLGYFAIPVVLALYLVCTPFMLISSFRANRRMKVHYDELVKQYDADLRLYPTLVANALECHRIAREQYEKDLVTYGVQCGKAALQKRQEDEAQAVYRSQMAEYQQAMELVEQKRLKERELLWERARVCTRCGTAYLAQQLN